MNVVSTEKVSNEKFSKKRCLKWIGLNHSGLQEKTLRPAPHFVAVILSQGFFTTSLHLTRR